MTTQNINLVKGLLRGVYELCNGGALLMAILALGLVGAVLPPLLPFLLVILLAMGGLYLVCAMFAGG